MLWTAPEILRNKYASKRGTQEGDVYSFAIILYEIHGRNGPFGDIEISPRGKEYTLMSVFDQPCMVRETITALRRISFL